MARDADEVKPPILICEGSRKPMEYLGLVPGIGNLPAVYAYRCLRCLRVATIELG
jgi:hypothetical protein